MPVILQFYNLIIRKDRLKALEIDKAKLIFEVGARHLFWEDEYLVHANGAMGGESFDTWEEKLGKLGLIGKQDGAWVDYIFLASGTTGESPSFEGHTCDWLDIEFMNRSGGGGARMLGDTSEEIHTGRVGTPWEPNTIQLNHDSRVEFNEEDCVENKDGELVNLSDELTVKVIPHDDSKEAEIHSAKKGAVFKLRNGQSADKGECIAIWDTQSIPLITRFGGKAEYVNFIEDLTYIVELDDILGYPQRLIIKSSQQPKIIVTNEDIDPPSREVFELPPNTTIRPTGEDWFNAERQSTNWEKAYPDVIEVTPGTTLANMPRPPSPKFTAVEPYTPWHIIDDE